MTCWKCNTYFCWICGQKLNAQEPYLHYRDPGSKCFNMLYHGLIPNDEDDEEDDFLVLGIYDFDDNIPDFSDDDDYDDDIVIEY